MPVKVGFLMLLVFGLVSAAGYLTYNSLSSIVSSIRVKSRPDLRLLLIRDLAADLDKAENSVRLYRFTQKQKDIQPYYTVIDGIDEKIDSLKSASNRDSVLLPQIDTISSLIEENLTVWNNMLDLYHSDSLDIYIRTLTAKIAVGTLNKKKPEKNILKRVFSSKALKNEALQQEAQHQQELINDLNKIERRDSLKNSFLLETETRLANTGNEIRKRLYNLIARMENEVILSMDRNAELADRLAVNTYRRLALFAISGSILILVVFFVVIRYVKKTREYQKALERSKEETEQLSKTKEMFMANMSHELRTPVNAIYGFSEQLGHEISYGENGKMLGVIKSAAGHLMQIVNDILDYAKLQNATIELENNHFLIQPLFEELQLLLSKNALDNHSRLTYNIDKSLPKALFGDVHRLKQILLNLIGNAIKFTTNGEICFSANYTNVSGNSFHLVLAVTDTGIGISREMQARVFDDFTQAEAGTSRKYGGTGLGLSIVKKLVELHQGTITLQSEEGKGTSIVCVLPYIEGDETRVKPAAVAVKVPQFIKGCAVLIVDDEVYNRMLFKTILTRWQVRFDEAGDGHSALEKLASGKYDLVFMDARMPGMDGIEAVKYIRNKLGISDKYLPIVGTSAVHSAVDMQTFRLHGMNGFLPKPFTEQMLLEIMTSILGNHQLPETDSILKEPEMMSPADTTPGESGYQPIPKEEASTEDLNLTPLYHLANNDLSFVKQLLLTFIESTETGLSEIEQALNGGNMEAIRETAHKISSPCRHIGAISLHSLLKMIEEQTLNNKNIGILAQLTSESILEFLVIKKGLQKHLEKI